MHKLLFLINYTEMARVTGVPIMYLLERGQSIKVISQLLRKAKQKGMIVPVMRKNISDDKYEGATVIDPIRGFYDIPIATLDFASLYPSIMMAHNLCYSTLLTKSQAEALPQDQWEKTPNGDYFIKSSVHQGLLPEILQELLSARSKAKKDMAAAADPFVQAVLNGRQLALKISANSVYGFTGAQVGQLPCLAISSSVTSYGREMIFHTKNTVEKRYTKANGYEFDAQVIYGDTDSVMVKFGTSSLEESMRLGKEAAGVVSEEFIKPIKLEFEKVYYPYLLMNKKRYAGLYWTKLDTFDKIDAKGIETVRRDNCLLVRNVITEALDTLLVQRSPEKAIENVKKHIQQLLLGKIDLSLLVISKSLAKGVGADDYLNKQPHSELAARMRKRDPLSAPNVGDRVPYVIIGSSKGAKTHEKSEDPLYALEHRLGIDTDWYLDHQLKKPLERIFEPILGDKVTKELFSGEHTNHVKRITNKGAAIFQFAKVVASCVRCKATLSAGQNALCTKCEPFRAEVYIEKNNEVRECEDHFSRLWSQCQRCQGSINQKVLCESKDCPIFYRRKKAQIDLSDAMAELDRFNTD
jgi:DNA polymerase delta subunit 1